MTDVPHRRPRTSLRPAAAGRQPRSPRASSPASAAGRRPRRSPARRSRRRSSRPRAAARPCSTWKAASSAASWSRTAAGSRPASRWSSSTTPARGPSMRRCWREWRARQGEPRRACWPSRQAQREPAFPRRARPGRGRATRRWRAYWRAKPTGCHAGGRTCAISRRCWRSGSRRPRPRSRGSRPRSPAPTASSELIGEEIAVVERPARPGARAQAAAAGAGARQGRDRAARSGQPRRDRPRRAGDRRDPPADPQPRERAGRAGRRASWPTTRKSLAELAEQLRATADRLARTLITAPVAGTVVDLKVKTPGGVIEPGRALLDLVPAGGELLLEARIAPVDIDEVHPGLEAQVHLLAYQSRNLPRVQGTVREVSADRLEDPDTHQPYYLARSPSIERRCRPASP